MDLLLLVRAGAGGAFYWYDIIRFLGALIPYVAEHAKAQHEVATIDSGVFRVSQHAGSALTERIYMFPVLAPYFHFAFGFAWALGLAPAKDDFWR